MNEPQMEACMKVSEQQTVDLTDQLLCSCEDEDDQQEKSLYKLDVEYIKSNV